MKILSFIFSVLLYLNLDAQAIIEEQRFIPQTSDSSNNSQFGESLSMDRELLVIGSSDRTDENGLNLKSNSGAAYIFKNQVTGGIRYKS